jgi:MoaA/NifB/PqqE/SkfB family radical SAM enzyme
MVPWFEVHINPDGSYHSCGAQPHPNRSVEGGMTRQNIEFTDKHNVFNMTIPEWINSEYQRRARLGKLSGTPEPRCNMCYAEEATGSHSKRQKENHKVSIFKENFETTYENSPARPYFEYSQQNQGLTDQLRPESYHMSLGNECNYACRMCNPWYSSRIAAEDAVKGTWTGPVRQNWTEDETAWNSVTDYICSTEKLKFVHIIGGEPLLLSRFEELVDKLLAAGKTDIYLGFTTNGSVFNRSLIEKLNAFRHVDIGISVECMGILNDHIRRGTDTEQVLKNIELYLKYKREAHVYITLRVVPSALSVHNLDQLLKWAADRRLDVMSNILVRPDHLQIKHLPDAVKQQLLEKYSHWEYSKPLPGIGNPRDPNRFKEHIDSEIRAIINNLKLPGDPELTKKMYATLEGWQWFDNPEIKKYFVLEQR